MKKQLHRTQRLAHVLKQMHEMENIRLVTARQDLAQRKDEEQLLVDALSAPALSGLPFMNNIGRRLNAASERVEQAAATVEQRQSECLQAKSKHAAVDKRAEKFKDDLDGLLERRLLERAIENFVNSSAPQASSATVSPRNASVGEDKRYERFDD